MADVMVRWRNDNAKTFENERIQEIANELDYLYFHTPTIFRARQYEISFTDNQPFALLRLEEGVELLDY